MNHPKTKLIVTLSLFALAGAASAQQNGFYGGISLGQANLNADAGTLDNGLNAAGGIGGISSSIDSKDTGFKLRLGDQLSQNLALEGGYIDFGKAKYSGAYSLPGAGSASGQRQVYGFNFDVLGSVPLDNGFSVFGKAGVLLSRVKTSAATADGSASFSNSATTLRPGLGGGVDYALSKNVDLRAEWERYFKVGNDSTGKNNADLLSAGLNYRF
ncbi:outer membrane protein P5 precursor [mine drainage metagenome]|uniref:Outer membrane protein P5 n=1 Tax=mine drainage metagenome TaxID=410659 RepID=A0A1J5RTK9_9ZZZZ